MGQKVLNRDRRIVLGEAKVEDVDQPGIERETPGFDELADGERCEELCAGRDAEACIRGVRDAIGSIGKARRALVDGRAVVAKSNHAGEVVLIDGRVKRLRQ